MEAWVGEVSPDLRYCLYEQGDRFSDNALAQIRQWIAKSRPTDKSLPLPLIEALSELEIALDNIGLTRFEKSLRHAASQDEIEARELEWKGIEGPKGEKKSKQGSQPQKAPKHHHVPAPVRPVSTALTTTPAPAPPKGVGGLGLAPYRPKPTQIPSDFPAYFHSELKARTTVILAEAVRN